MGFLDKLLGNDDERFSQLVKISLEKPTTGIEHGVKPFTFEKANTYAYTYVNSAYYEILVNENDAIRIPYSSRRLKNNDPNFYIVTIRETKDGLALFEAELDNI
ncbi:hypothetical protein GPUN_2096 [Glaciecola punicea ACAM 611]|uniref:Uncharacterized protein n=1 Tax=Glaciecola punicea ACAM 611 TaxID=1121923 RepID=H5TD34_9ALTE|nr:hypothetical protein [Glaciecola punicea]GAB56211.1 hypothetical protein GPUN_2096 [Glaciecola punicea ACAM 611]